MDQVDGKLREADSKDLWFALDFGFFEPGTDVEDRSGGALERKLRFHMPTT